MSIKKKPTTTTNNVISLPDAVTNVALLNLVKENKKLALEQKKICEMAARTILHALDCKDSYTYGHSMRVAFLSLTLGKEIGLNEEELYDLELSALFHDIGKIGVPDSVLLKPARLTEDEFLQMKSHPEKSAEILRGFSHFEKVAKYAKHHHERWDGRGYPEGLKGEDIPLFSRIILIADTFDAMTSSRPYRKGLDYEVAFAELEEFSGSQFDPELAKAFITAMRRDANQKEETFELSIVEGKFLKNAA
ncbi:HD-GYP domain-containing protein [Bacteriovorax sp. Seq25_V]|uniref:HD-GYP domain-containing protein n=1 Tax=Bacteriovorax sp. Seq25_V TaxID=1201288 RepID=UPI000389F3C5|nr:HD-GYP domain-containing protein [Bacteriovorax sp. Seq25_V]EQC47355.1 HDIG domain protein [Bacteriovorax sp. Seq25_V]